MSISTAANVVRWTPTRIAKAIRCPKPKGAIAKARQYENGPLPDWKDPKALQILAHIANNADLLDIPTPAEYGRDPDRWLLVRAPMWLIEALALFGSEFEELEADPDGELASDDEPSPDDEQSNDDEDNGDDEPSNGWGSWAPDWQTWRFPRSEST